MPERNCLCLCASAETATKGNTHVFSVSGQRSHQPINIPLIAQTGKRRKKGKRSRSARILDMVRCRVATVLRISSHRSPPHYLASYWHMLTSLYVRFYHLVCVETSTFQTQSVLSTSLYTVPGLAASGCKRRRARSEKPCRQGSGLFGYAKKSPEIECGNLYTHFWHFSCRRSVF